MINISLHDVSIVQRTCRCEGCFDCHAQIDADNLTRAPARSKLRVPAFATASFEHDLVSEKLGRYGRDPTKKLFGVFFIFLCEVLPLPAKTCGCSALVTLDALEVCKTRNSGGYRKRRSARCTPQFTLHDLFVFNFRDREIQ